MDADRERPIGVFDSGLGGLTVANAILNRLPNERILYFGDTARLPYGNKSPETVTRFSREIAEFLMRRHIKALVVACNSASAMALDHLQREFSVPVIGVIEPGARAAVAMSSGGRIGVLGTSATVRSEAYLAAIRREGPSLTVVQAAAPLFVHLVEEGWTSGDVPRAIAHRYLEPLLKAKVDAVILGCTHYPLLASMLQEAFGPDVTLVDSAGACAEALQNCLEENGIGARAASSTDRLTCFASDASEAFSRLGERFLGHSLGEVVAVEQSDQPWYAR